MKQLLILILAAVMFTIPAFGSEKVINAYVKELEGLSKEQTKIMLYSYQVGEPEDLGYSLAAIAWKESLFGKYLMNIYDGKLGSYGVYHILLEYAVARARVKDEWNTSRLAEKLTFDLEFSAKEALGELVFWRTKFSRHSSQWKSMFAAYNAGTIALRSKKGRQYAEDAVLRVKALERFFEKHKILDKLDKKPLVSKKKKK